MSSTLQVDSALKGRLERHSFAYANKRFLKIFPKQEVGEVSGCSPKAGQAWGTGKTLPWERQDGAGLDYWEGWQGREGRVWSLQIFASGISQTLPGHASCSSHMEWAAVSPESVLSSHPSMPAAAIPSCQQQSPLLQIPLILLLIQHMSLLTHPIFKNLLVWEFFHLSH